MGKTGPRGLRGVRGLRRWLAWTAAVTAALLVMSISLVGPAQARSGYFAGAGAIGPAARAGAQSTASDQPAASDKKCFYTYPDCSSIDPAVAFTIVSDGDTSGCTFKTTAAWGDKSSSTKTYPGGANGSTIATFDHTYTDDPRSYTITVTSKTTVGGCGNANGTLGFTLAAGCTSGTAVRARGPAAARAEQCNYCPAPAEPGAEGSAKEAGSQASYFYAHSYTPDTTGTYAAGTFKVADPKVAAGDCHSLAELAVASEKTLNDQLGNVIEVGWTVDPALADGHDPNVPHLFVFYWVAGKAGCYDTRCKGLDKVGNLVGSVLATGSKPVLSIEHEKDYWDIFDGSELIGRYPDSLWSGGFTKFHLAQWFGEVAAAPGAAKTCTEMGNGLYASNKDADTITAMTLRDENKRLSPDVFTRNATPDFYTAEKTSETAIRFGGKGACG